MSNYILTTDGELYHYGVKGMKWGVRKAQKLAKKDAKEFARAKMFYGEGAGTRRKLIKNTVNERSKDPNYKKAKKLAKSLAGDKALYDTSETTNKYLIARQKAKKDKAYKNSAEYKQARTAYGKQQAQQYLFGTAGHQRIETLKNMGVSEKKAKVRTAVEQTLLAAGIMAAVGGIGYATRNR